MQLYQGDNCAEILLSMTQYCCWLCAESESEMDPPPNEVITDTEVWVWGDNQKGQLGLGDTLNRLVPWAAAVVRTFL